MKKLISLIVLLVAVMFAQTPGTVTKSTVNTVTAVAGAVTCVLTNSVPATATGPSMVCKDSITTITQSGMVPVGSKSGTVGSFNSAGDSVTWILTQLDASSPVSYQIVANGVASTGSF